jgi:hypothetical protein
MEAAVWGFIGTLIGALASIATNVIASRNAAALQNSAASASREEQRKAFQRDTLLRLQDDLHRLLRRTFQIHLSDLQSFRATGKWGSEALPEELNSGHMETVRDVNVLIERVAEDALRTELKAFVISLNEVTFARSQNDADRRLEAMNTRAVQVLERVGTVLRAQY